MNQKVRVRVNGVSETYFLGLRVRHAIGHEAVKAVQEQRAQVYDDDGNIVGLDGSLYDGETLNVGGIVHLSVRELETTE